jgi:hypothetical protein
MRESKAGVSDDESYPLAAEIVATRKIAMCGGEVRGTRYASRIA